MLFNLCVPAFIYLVVSLLAFFLNIGMNGKITFIGLGIAIIMTIILNMICNKYSVKDSWYALFFLLFFPIIITVIILIAVIAVFGKLE
jgi:hypothetical protein